MKEKIRKFKSMNFVELKNEVLRIDNDGTMRAISYNTYYEILADIWSLSKENNIEV